MWIGLDDTDSKNGGCTTFSALVLISRLNQNGFDLIGFPRLVRLNPNIPWKTRGNGAISFRIGRGIDKKNKIGSFQGEDIFCFLKEKSGFDVDTSLVKNIIEGVISDYSKLDDDNTNSGFVISDKKPSYDLYVETVQDVIKIDHITNVLDDIYAFYHGYKNKRGLIGATASISWDDRSDFTFELIAYREKKMWGKKRFFDSDSAIEVDKKFSSTFDNYDYKNKHNRLIPSSPCPVLFGIRGEKFKDLIDAEKIINSEKIDGWIVFKSNQGSDDHLQRIMIKDIKSFKSVICKGKVVSIPKTIKGGHVIFSISDNTGIVDCAAYEPTKEFRDIIRCLIPGDIIDVYGGIREEPLTINIEKIRIISLEKDFVKVENPVCPNCGKHMKSKGKNQGFKCVRCKTKSNKPIIVEKNRDIKTGFYEVPVCSRRHLSKPLKRMK